MAILYRVNALSRVLEDQFRREGVPYVIARGTAFYDRKEIKDAMAYLRMLANAADDVAFRRIVNCPPRGLGESTIKRRRTAARLMPSVAMVRCWRELRREAGMRL